MFFDYHRYCKSYDSEPIFWDSAGSVAVPNCTCHRGIVRRVDIYLEQANGRSAIFGLSDEIACSNQTKFIENYRIINWKEVAHEK